MRGIGVNREISISGSPRYGQSTMPREAVDLKAQMRSRPTVPVHFVLLPSMLPNQALTPVLYSVWRGIAIYRTLDPSPSASYVSLSTLSLALELPVLHLLSRFHLQTGDYDMTLGGVAPWRDLWVTFAVARRVLSKLGLGDILGAGETSSGRGLLSKSSDTAVSWDDGDGGIAHNWLPPSRAVPLSSYSLASLSDSSFSRIQVLPNERFVRTPLDSRTRQRLSGRDRLDVEDWTGLGRRRAAFFDVLELSVSAWESYLRHPSVPSPPKPALWHSFERPSSTMIAQNLLQSLPHAIADIDAHFSFSPHLYDLKLLLPKSHESPSIRTAASVLLHTVLDKVFRARISQAIMGLPFESFTDKERHRLEALARAQLGLAEAMGWTLVAAWVAEPGEPVDESTVNDSDPGVNTPPARSLSLEELDVRRGGSPAHKAVCLPEQERRAAAEQLHLYSEEGAVWLYVVVFAVVSFCVWSGMGR